MVETTRQRQGELLPGVFETLRPHPAGLQPKAVLAELEQVVPAATRTTPTMIEGGMRL